METPTFKAMTAQPPALANLPDLNKEQQALSPSSLFDMAAEEEKPEEVQPVVTEVQSVQTTEEPEVIENENPEPVVEEKPTKKTTTIESPLGDFEVPTSEEPEPEPVREPEVQEQPEDLPEKRKAAQEAFAAQKRQIKEQKQIIAELSPLKAEVENLRKQIAEIPKADPEIASRARALDEELERTKLQLKETRTRLAEISLNEDDEYRGKVTTPLQEEILPVIGVIVQSTNGEITKEYIDQLAVLDPVTQRQKVNELKDKLDPQDFADLKSMLPKYRDVIKTHNDMKKNAEGRQQLRRQEQEKGQQRQFQEYSEAYTSSFDQHDQALQKKFYGESLDPEFKGALDHFDKAIKNVNPLNADPKVMAGIMALAKNQPIIVAVLERQIEKQKAEYEAKITALTKENKELTAANKKFSSATPNAGTTTAGSSAPSQKPKEDEIDLKKNPLTAESLAAMLG